MTTLHGFADEGFGPVADAFLANFREGVETGAAASIYQDGRLVLDLYAGLADPATTTEWSAETLTVIFSSTKGLMALCGYLARQKGLLDFDALVSTVWPEFAQNGKDTITIRDLFSHRSGLMALDVDLTLDDVAAWTPVIHAIEQQRPLWEPGTTFAYHALTYGWLTGEVLRRVTGMRPGALLASYLSEPLGVDAWIGLPSSHEHRVATMLPGPPITNPLYAAFLEKARSMPPVVRSMTLGGAFPAAVVGGETSDFNSRAVHEMEIPAANGITNATGLARIYSAAVTDRHGPRLLDDDSIADALVPRSFGEGWSGAMNAPGIRFSTGFMINGYALRPLLTDSSFGHDGASGSLAYADVDTKIGFGYVNNQMAGGLDERANRLTMALRGCLGV